ncbi:dATP/dGTP pyrophosphohydrolase domain-containing protein [Chlorobium sp.]|uniref:dATP/dGTP pyrophosphohydrolase domain-containing protein n=1 Tax=Chlorobium sp. TaxID=1095 RepID=UPI003C4CDD52
MSTDLIKIIERQIEFSVNHICKEIDEVAATEGKDLSEWVDIIILALDGAWRAGFTPKQIVDGLIRKQGINELRTWPDWRTAEPGKAIEHIRDETAGDGDA